MLSLVRPVALCRTVELVAGKPTKQELDLPHKVGPESWRQANKRHSCKRPAPSYGNGYVNAAYLSDSSIEEHMYGLEKSIATVHEERFKEKVNLVKTA